MVEGLPSIIAAVVFFFVLPPAGPASATWLTEEERRIICARLARPGPAADHARVVVEREMEQCDATRAHTDRDDTPHPDADCDVQAVDPSSNGNSAHSNGHSSAHAQDTPAVAVDSPLIATELALASDADAVSVALSSMTENSRSTANSSEAREANKDKDTSCGFAIGSNIKGVLHNPRMLCVMLLIFCHSTITSGMSMFLPALLQQFGFAVLDRYAPVTYPRSVVSSLCVSILLTIPVRLCSITGEIFVGFHSDKTQERFVHAAIPGMHCLLSFSRCSLCD